MSDLHQLFISHYTRVDTHKVFGCQIIFLMHLIWNRVSSCEPLETTDVAVGCANVRPSPCVQRAAGAGGGDGAGNRHVLSLPAGQDHEELPAAARGVSWSSPPHTHTASPSTGS